MTGRNSLHFLVAVLAIDSAAKLFSLRERRPGIDGSNAPAAMYAPNRTNPAKSKANEDRPRKSEGTKKRGGGGYRIVRSSAALLSLGANAAAIRKVPSNEAKEFYRQWLLALECGSQPYALLSDRGLSHNAAATEVQTAQRNISNE